MKTVIADIKRYWQDRPFLWSGKQYFPAGYVRLPISGRVLVLAPHPDDPESVAITCRLLAQSGCEIWYAVVSLSPAGVEDEYARKWDFGGSLSLKEIKGRIRRREQIRSAEMFGLSSNRIAFLGIAEERNLDSHENIDRIKDHLGFHSTGPGDLASRQGLEPNSCLGKPYFPHVRHRLDNQEKKIHCWSL